MKTPNWHPTATGPQGQRLTEAQAAILQALCPGDLESWQLIIRGHTLEPLVVKPLRTMGLIVADRDAESTRYSLTERGRLHCPRRRDRRRQPLPEECADG